MNNDFNNNRRYETTSYRNPEGEVADPTVAVRSFMNKVYNWMSLGLALTGVAAYYMYQKMTETHEAAKLAANGIGEMPIFWNSSLMIGLIIAEFALVIVLSWAIHKLSPVVAATMFAAYAILSGVTLAPILMMYASSTIYAAFFSAAGMFAATSIYGYVTRKDLTSLGSLAFMGLIGIIIATLINFFLKSEGLTMIISYVGVAVFLGLTAWDTQKLKQIALGMDENDVHSDQAKKVAIIGALALYLDFINLFIMLLRIFGRRD